MYVLFYFILASNIRALYSQCDTIEQEGKIDENLKAKASEMIKNKTGIEIGEMIKIDEYPIGDKGDKYYYNKPFESKEDDNKIALNQLYVSAFTCKNNDGNSNVCDEFILMNKALFKKKPDTFKCLIKMSKDCKPEEFTILTVLNNDIVNKLYTSNSLIDFMSYYGSMLNITKNTLDKHLLILTNKTKPEDFFKEEKMRFIDYWGYYYDPISNKISAFPRFLDLSKSPEERKIIFENESKLIKKQDPKTKAANKDEQKKESNENNNKKTSIATPNRYDEEIIEELIIFIKEVMYAKTRCKYILQNKIPISPEMIHIAKKISESKVSVSKYIKNLREKNDRTSFNKAVIGVSILPLLYCKAMQNDYSLELNTELLSQLFSLFKEITNSDMNLNGDTKKNFANYFLKRDHETNAVLTASQVKVIIANISAGYIKVDQVPDYLIIFKSQIAKFKEQDEKMPNIETDDDHESAFKILTDTIYNDIMLSEERPTGVLKAFMMEMDKADKSLKANYDENADNNLNPDKK